ncbi:hypothetical protein BUN12_0014 [Bacillus amyloliquefaciens]|nr:hypothetical protein BUN12_0014 [Bacillus amyloliquefaciens]
MKTIGQAFEELGKNLRYALKGCQHLSRYPRKLLLY